MRADTQHRKQVEVKVPARLSAEAIERFYAELQQALQAGAETVWFNCSEVHSVQSNHIAVLWGAREMCETAAVRTLLKDPTSGLKRVIQLLDLQELFDIEDSAQPGIDQASKVSEPRENDVAFADRFEATLLEVDRTLHAFLDYLKRLGVPETTRFDLQTIFYEVVTNISHHAGLPPGELISFRAEPTGDSVVLVFEDAGKPFDPTAYRSNVNVREAAQAGRTRGFGLPMLRKLTDDMVYDRIDDRINRLRIRKQWRKKG